MTKNEMKMMINKYCYVSDNQIHFYSEFDVDKIFIVYMMMFMIALNND